MNLFRVSESPHVRAGDTTQRIMLDVIIALVPACVYGVYNFGIQALIRLLVGVFACVLIEAIYQKANKKKVTVSDLSAALTGLLLAMNLPATFPIWMEVVGCAFAIILVKQLFGGLGQNFMNPTLAARCFLVLAYTKDMTNYVLDGVSSPTPLAILKPGSSLLEQVSLKEMFFGGTNGVIGETSVLLLLIGAAYLIIRRVIDVKIPLIYIGTFAAFTFLLTPGHNFDFIYLLKEICGGGLILGAFFMATDYVTAPTTPRGKVYFGLTLGGILFVFRMFGTSTEGVAYSIIFTNLLVPFMELGSTPKPFGLEKRVKGGKNE